jgi:hypothetical protein
MKKFETTNSFAALSVDFFDSDDSGYAEDEIDPPASNPAPPETSIYTPSERGLVQRIDWPECCSIRPLHVRANDFVNQSPDNEVLEVVRVYWDKELKDTMVVRLCDVRSREYDPSVEIIGRVSRKAHRYAAKRLLELVGKAVTPERH